MPAAGARFDRSLEFACVHIAKDSPGVGAVHQTTALGNADWRRRRRRARQEAALLIDGDAAGVPDDASKSWSLPVVVKRTDDDQRLVFGWASVSERNGMLVTDAQGDQIEADELERAAYDFVLHSRQQGEMHERVGVGRLIESMVFTRAKQAVLGIDLGSIAWWVGFFVDDDATWAAIKSCDLPEFSIGGHARPVEV